MDSRLIKINGTMIESYCACPRQLWLYGRGIVVNPDNVYLQLGRHIHETYYRNERKELFIDETIKIDVLSSEKLVGEIKKSSKLIEAARMQLAFYLYYLKQKGIIMEGILLIPLERRKEKISLTPEIEEKVEKTIREIKEILSRNTPPPLPEKKSICSKCSYREFCWS